MRPPRGKPGRPDLFFCEISISKLFPAFQNCFPFSNSLRPHSENHSENHSVSHSEQHSENHRQEPAADQSGGPARLKNRRGPEADEPKAHERPPAASLAQTARPGPTGRSPRPERWIPPAVAQRRQPRPAPARSVRHRRRPASRWRQRRSVASSVDRPSRTSTAIRTTSTQRYPRVARWQRD